MRQHDKAAYYVNMLNYVLETNKYNCLFYYGWQVAFLG